MCLFKIQLYRRFLKPIHRIHRSTIHRITEIGYHDGCNEKAAFINPEDVPSGGDVKFNDEDVERVRRAHLNDLENIPLFLVTGLLYVLTDPSTIPALMMFRIYTLARIGHTCVYAIYVVRQPARGICFLTGLGINFIMIVFLWVNFPQL